jgi:hypothetical protein
MASGYPLFFQRIIGVGRVTERHFHEFAGFKDYKPADLKKLLDLNNTVAESCHYGMPELKSNLDERLAWAKELGMKQMILASMPIPRQNAKLADWDRACDRDRPQRSAAA